ncbi:MAG TPA: peptidylprolyl isomerase [Longimicrobiales bacterium]
MTRLAAFGALAALTVFAGCDGLRQAMTAHTDVVARAGGLELTVDEATGLLLQDPRLPAEPEVVEAVANLWVDYVLLATAVHEDSTLASLDVAPLIDPMIENRMLEELNRKVVNADTALTDEQLRQLYEEQQPGLQIRARHILLRVDPGAPPEVRDSVLERARELRAQAVAGADFAELARQYSEDPGSAEKGGDLGFFGRGRMVAPFDEAAFALDVGEISDVVETAFGYHVIKVEERKAPEFAEVKDQFRQQVQSQRLAEASEAYMKQLTDPLGVSIEEGAFQVARDLARKPTLALSGRAASRALVSYQGGDFTAEEYLAFLRTRTSPNDRARLASMTDQALENVLRGIATHEILLEEAREDGIEVTQAERDSLADGMRTQLVTAARNRGLGDVTPQEGETVAQAIERRVGGFLTAVIRGDAQILGLGPLSFSLREDGDAEVFDRAFTRVVDQLQARRAVAPPAGAPTPAQPPAPDSSR